MTETISVITVGVGVRLGMDVRLGVGETVCVGLGVGAGVSVKVGTAVVVGFGVSVGATVDVIVGTTVGNGVNVGARFDQHINDVSMTKERGQVERQESVGRSAVDQLW